MFSKKKIPIYWENFRYFLLSQSQKLNDSRYNYADIGSSKKTCLLYSDVEEKSNLACDFYISMGDTSVPDKNDYLWGTDYKDESLIVKNEISFLPCVKSIRRNENADSIIFLMDKDSTPRTKLMIEYLSGLFENTHKYLSEEVESLTFLDIEPQLLRCKKFISFSKNRILNQYFSVLFGDNFILCSDDKSSPLRYAYVGMRHPSLRDKEESLFDKNCEFKYGGITSNFRNLVIEINKIYDDNVAEISPEMVFKEVERQCLKKTSEKNYIDKIKTKTIALPFVFAGWSRNKKSLSALINFVEEHKDDEDMRKLLLSYLLIYMPLDYWKILEQRYADNLDFSSEFKKNIEAISENSPRDYIFKWACGTYIRSLQDGNIYKCSWNDKSLATCLDLALNHQDHEIIEKVKQLYSLEKYKNALGLSLVEVFIDNAIILQKEISLKLIEVCPKLLMLDEKFGFSNYGEKIFYTVVLFWMEGKYEKIISFLDQTFDVVRTRGFLSKTALFLLKQTSFNFKDVAAKLLQQEDDVLLAKNPEKLQLKILAHLELNELEAAENCLKYLRENKTYFQTFSSGFDKWFLQSCIEKKLGHFSREKRFEFIYKALGKIPNIWEAFK